MQQKTLSRVSRQSRQTIERLLGYAGVTVGGDNAWDIIVHDERFYDRVLSEGSVGLGEAYMDGWWDVPELDQFFYKILRAGLEDKIKTFGVLVSILKVYVGNKLFNFQKKSRAFEVGERHYDIGNDLYMRMLDKRMAYTCGYWSGATSATGDVNGATGAPAKNLAQDLDSAEEAKLDLICRKIGLKPGMTVLDIGCGWGSFMKFATEKYGVTCVGVTVSREQTALGEKLCAGLPVTFALMDYRDIPEKLVGNVRVSENGVGGARKFDRIVSIGMFEHVGRKNYRRFFDVVEKSLADDGLFLLHTIGSNMSQMSVDPWTEKYIFPNGMLPSQKQIADAYEEHFVLEDMHNFGADYDKTLMAWFRNFDKHWPEISAHYSERFYRMWKYYLLSCAGSFRARRIQLWQFVFSKKGLEGGYTSMR